MRFGNCVSYKDTESIKILKQTGFDYIETALSSLYSATESELSDFIKTLDENEIKCETVNVLFPGGITLTGENADHEKAKSYITEIFEKTKNIGFKRVVFGSGGARKVPDGFPKEKATEQIIQVINNYLLPAAEKYNFTLAIEELNRGETNIINTLEEAEYIAEQINNPRIKILADLYHMGLENTDIKILTKLAEKNLIAHCHIANPYNNRYYPQPFDSAESIKLYKSFFNSLKSAGYNERISIEGGIRPQSDFYTESKTSLEFMKTLI
jgi:sugar phosphate isomerase/epimerase